MYSTSPWNTLPRFSATISTAFIGIIGRKGDGKEMPQKSRNIFEGIRRKSRQN